MEGRRFYIANITCLFSILGGYTSDETLPSLNKALSALNGKQSIPSIEKEYESRLSPVYPIPNFPNKLNKKEMEFALKLSGKLFNLQSIKEKSSPYFQRQRFIFLRTLLRFSEKIPKWKLSLQKSLLPSPSPKDILEISPQNKSKIYFQFLSNGERVIFCEPPDQLPLKSISEKVPMSFRVENDPTSPEYEHLSFEFDREYATVDGSKSNLLEMAQTEMKGHQNN